MSYDYEYSFWQWAQCNAVTLVDVPWCAQGVSRTYKRPLSSAKSGIEMKWKGNGKYIRHKYACILHTLLSFLFILHKVFAVWFFFTFFFFKVFFLRNAAFNIYIILVIPSTSHVPLTHTHSSIHSLLLMLVHHQRLWCSVSGCDARPRVSFFALFVPLLYDKIICKWF